MALKYIDRRGTDSAKWDALDSQFGDPDLLAMWVADMDFKEAPCITEALKKYIDTAAFGYYSPGKGYFDAFIEWEKKYHGYDVKREWICFAPGIVPAFNWVLLWATKPDDAVILLTPVYYPMINAAKWNDRTLIQCDLVRNGMDYTIDFEKFEKDIVENDVKLFIMSSPHNPIGRVWTPEELRRLMEICRKHNVLVISDEIHQDFVFGANKHYPTATLGDYDDFCITMTAASKTFNLAGLQNSMVIIPNEELRERYLEYQRRIHTYDGNAFGFVAVEAAYKGGRAWLEEIKAQIYSNFEYVRDTFAKEIPDVTVADLQGTYLLWMNFEKYFKTQEEVKTFMQDKCGIAFDYGEWFGGDNFVPFVRMNLATTHELVDQAVQSIIREIKKL
ncbi:MAG: pyridoxal phosphate-dependent aminotransferase [Eubacteriales bacterium]|jgi:cystathionine beta-lyase|nr:pyridoxal phosphate-dependent aminotransferase [Eubacteriales bacterium]